MATPPINQWKTLDKDLSRIGLLEEATQFVARPLVAPGIGLAFIVLAGVFAAILMGAQPGGLIVVFAAAIGAYMALNIGANDVANNMGPAVGANALTLGGALIIAAIFEVSGSLIAGGDVVKTVSTGILAPEAVPDAAHFIWAMMAALLASALWLHVATWMGAPVSTTHSIVGGVVGAGVAAAGFGAVNWPAIATISASWVISPIMGGIFAALFLAFIKAKIIYVEDKIAAARKWVPMLIGFMSGTFAAYLALKGLTKILHISLGASLLIGVLVGLVAWGVSVPLVRAQSAGQENRKKTLKKLFTIPLIVSAALLSFAHGANDVANAVGPLAAIVHAVQDGTLSDKVEVPFWIMAVGAFGISVGLTLFGPRLIKLVGSEITKLNAMRAYCVALSAAITVIVASWLGLPVSSTHIAVGGVFGVGFYREWHAERRARLLGLQKGKVVPPEERSRRLLVRRSHITTVVAAWIITVPASAVLSAGLYWLMNALDG
ncbi:inorganic phosphate transporter [Rhodobacter capsulatus]|uniref:Phosphate transporter n=1 Tax=Rhodobacter capsulatus (strain ATCC BAA-309 / NBRC 16581 / SB1003) TaxID=272942 RepID=D5ASV3_RHOCB|nr:inorganic phosphate transporter [Rhodobacter capsulatus]ADE87194.1 phosphate transporter [Rhodobacter capsulatus SB 1003]ETD03419.1 inorganic phosphate transporter [Rhodobacter capsulatus DE442]ETD80214.1 inorganic phosphate transporter [Rhodobacter capsulatus R121]ETE55479.1 inorganic phosphate transporter [Rhodobacter capsulatus Y262]MDS0925291.1 inorganic phosphate transporter [Rhodobacter capsulatus]